MTPLGGLLKQRSRSKEITRNEAPFEHPQAFEKERLTVISRLCFAKEPQTIA